jgi:hypothetical protein
MSTATTIGCTALLGLLTGTHAATWGAFKDSPFEGFKRPSFLRSIVVAVTAALALATTTGLTTALGLPVLVGVLYATERFATEWWKSFVREDEQGAYAIPMRIAVLGRPVDARFPRYVAGAAVLAGVVLAGWVVAALQPEDGGPVLLSMLFGAVGGWLTAAGGAWKDAPVEGFSGWKFLRSPVVATAWTGLLMPFTTDWVALAVGAGGLSVLSIETYKTFFTRGRPPGKFDGKPVRHVAQPQRHRCRLLHASTYAALASATGLAALVDPAATPSPTVFSLAGLTAAALTIAVLVACLDPARGRADRRRVVRGADRLDRQSRTSRVEVALRRAER